MMMWIDSANMKRKRRLLAKNARAARSFVDKLLGLMFKKTFMDMDALILEKCPSIHTFFMRFPIDVLFVDVNHQVVSVYEKLRPWRLCVPDVYDRRVSAIELPAGTIGQCGVSVGDLVVVLA